MELFAVALACWGGARNEEPEANLVAMLGYNLLVGAYFVSVGAGASGIGPLL